MTDFTAQNVAAYIDEIARHAGGAIPPDAEVSEAMENPDTGRLHVIIDGKHWFLHDNAAVCREEIADGATYWTAYRDGQEIDSTTLDTIDDERNEQ